jgi:hypothetical protein
MFRRRDKDQREASEELIGTEPESTGSERTGSEGTEDEFDDADVEAQAADYMADNDTWMYGPNADAILEIIDTLEEFEPAEAQPLAAAWNAVPKIDREKARKAARKIAEKDEELGRHLQLAREAVATWVAVKGVYPEFAKIDPAWSKTCAQAGEAALDATTAIILEGVLSEFDYEALIAPWSETIAELESAEEAEDPSDVDQAEGDEEAVEEESEEDSVGEFGPNGTLVDELLSRLWMLTPEQVGRMIGGWQNIDRGELKAAHDAVKEIAEDDSEIRKQLVAAQSKITPWVNGARSSEQNVFLGAAGQRDSRGMAGPALADAVSALVVGDLLDPFDAETLYSAWFSVVGAPSLPEEAEPESTPSGTAKTKSKKLG